LREGDVLVIQAIDRLGRDVVEVARTVQELNERGVGLVVLNQQGLDTRTSTGRMIFHVLLALAQWERESIVERTKHGLAVAREKGRIGGAAPKVPDAKIIQGVKRMARGARAKDVADELGISRSAIYKRRLQLQRDGKL